MNRQQIIAGRPFLIVRGGGDLATGTIDRLTKAGYPVLVLETEYPAAIRRQVSVCEAVYDSRAQVEDLTAVMIGHLEQLRKKTENEKALCVLIWERIRSAQAEGAVPVLTDEKGESIRLLRPDIVVDAIIAKRNLGTNRNMAPLTIALGPGFEAGADTDFVVETMRGHNLGRIYDRGMAQPDTGVPGAIAGYAAERVIHAPCAGTFFGTKKIGEIVQAGEALAEIRTENGREAVRSQITGLIRGMLRDGYPVTEGFKIADVDPREGELRNCFTISDKARCIAGSVLELVCRFEREGMRR